MQNLHDLFEHELKDIYDAETRLLDALRKQSGEANDPEIAEGFETHMEETRGQIERLERVFDLWGMEPSRGEGCAGIEGLLEEHRNFTREDPAPEILDVFLLSAAAKVERYEITAYESLVRLADQMGLEDAVELLEENLREEEVMLEQIQDLFETGDLIESAKTGRTTSARR